MIRPEADNIAKTIHSLREQVLPDAPAVGRTPAEKCARIKDLGYVASKHITMYGERLELVSDPVQEGGCIVVEVISGNDPTLRRLQLPVSILLSSSDQGGEKTKFGKGRR